MGRAARLRSERLAEKLRHIRAALSLSQNELIRHLGLEEVIYQSSVSGYESGEREPPLPILLRYAEAAGVCLDVLANDKLDCPPSCPSSRSTSIGDGLGKPPTFWDRSGVLGKTARIYRSACSAEER
jgi:transcriptional regulator with XRE-family HTH domain